MVALRFATAPAVLTAVAWFVGYTLHSCLRSSGSATVYAIRSHHIRTFLRLRLHARTTFIPFVYRLLPHSGCGSFGLYARFCVRTVARVHTHARTAAVCGSAAVRLRLPRGYAVPVATVTVWFVLYTLHGSALPAFYRFAVCGLPFTRLLVGSPFLRLVHVACGLVWFITVAVHHARLRTARSLRLHAVTFLPVVAVWLPRFAPFTAHTRLRTHCHHARCGLRDFTLPVAALYRLRSRLHVRYGSAFAAVLPSVGLLLRSPVAFWLPFTTVMQDYVPVLRIYLRVWLLHVWIVLRCWLYYIACVYILFWILRSRSGCRCGSRTFVLLRLHCVHAALPPCPGLRFPLPVLPGWFCLQFTVTPPAGFVLPDAVLPPQFTATTVTFYTRGCTHTLLPRIPLHGCLTAFLPTVLPRLPHSSARYATCHVACLPVRLPFSSRTTVTVHSTHADSWFRYIPWFTVWFGYGCHVHVVTFAAWILPRGSVGYLTVTGYRYCRHTAHAVPAHFTLRLPFTAATTPRVYAPVTAVTFATTHVCYTHRIAACGYTRLILRLVRGSFGYVYHTHGSALPHTRCRFAGYRYGCSYVLQLRMRYVTLHVLLRLPHARYVLRFTTWFCRLHYHHGYLRLFTRYTLVILRLRVCGWLLPVYGSTLVGFCGCWFAVAVCSPPFCGCGLRTDFAVTFFYGWFCVLDTHIQVTFTATTAFLVYTRSDFVYGCSALPTFVYTLPRTPATVFCSRVWFIYRLHVLRCTVGLRLRFCHFTG